ncbi:CaiB/BaiF CoA transferase family protein [Dactylosporangium sp. CA-092794]|uniref:CaiB/BaiF CoA transferase family protein n=1 Tax=Dactylosporangium sp. CA-092794 TaxID=3239929 RepID=UPI003D948F5E
MLLADMGATVVKVESPEGDDTRRWRPPVRGDESSYYLSINRNKHSIVLDFAQPGDLAVARDLARRADVVVENFRAGGLARFGLDYESVRSSNPAVVYASITGFGTREGADLPGYDLLVQALSGLMSLTGAPEGPGFRSGVAVFDVIAGLHVGLGVLAALRDRDRSGEGQLVEVDLMSSALSGLVNQSATYVMAGVVPMRMGNEHPSLYPYGPMPTADGDLIIAAGNDRQFRTLCGALRRPELADDERFVTVARRNANRAALRPLLEEALSAHDAQEWFRRLRRAGVPSAPIQDVAQGIATAVDLGLEPVVTVGDGDDSVPMIRHPVTFSRTPAGHDLVPPALGSATDRVRRWLAEPSANGRPPG